MWDRAVRSHFVQELLLCLDPCSLSEICCRYACAWPCTLLILTLTHLPWRPGLTLDLLQAFLLITAIWLTVVVVTGPALLYLLGYCGNTQLVNEETAPVCLMILSLQLTFLYTGGCSCCFLKESCFPWTPRCRNKKRRRSAACLVFTQVKSWTLLVKEPGRTLGSDNLGILRIS